MKFNADLAELTGIILGDGSFYVKDTFYQLDIALNSKEPIYISSVKRLIRRIMSARIGEKQGFMNSLNLIL